MLHIFTTIFQTQNKQNCRNKASIRVRETFFLEQDASTSACVLHQHSTLCSTGQSSVGGENASFDLNRPSHSVTQILDKGGSNALVLVLSGNRLLISTTGQVWWCTFDFRSPSKFFLEVGLYHLSPSIVFMYNSGCIDGLPAGLNGSGEVLFSWKGVFCQSGF